MTNNSFKGDELDVSLKKFTKGNSVMQANPKNHQRNATMTQQSNVAGGGSTLMHNDINYHLNNQTSQPMAPLSIKPANK